MMTAIFLATATAAFRNPFRAASLSPQLLSAENFFVRFKTAQPAS
jgi:hypothetical protein